MKAFFKKIGTWLANLLFLQQKAQAEERNISAPVPVTEPEIPTHLHAQVSPQPGLTCPRCSFKIQLTIPSLLSGQPIICHQCFLVLNLDTQKSAEALKAMQKFQSDLDRAREKGKG